MARLSDKRIINALRETRGLVAVAARKLGCSRTTIYDRIEKSPAVREALEEARDYTLDTAESSLFRAIENGEAWAVCFYLKTQGKGRGYVERQEVEHSGRVEGPVLNIVLNRPKDDGDGANA